MFKYILIFSLVFSASCSYQPINVVEPPDQKVRKKEDPKLDMKVQRLRKRSQIPVARNRYEGSLWQDESSWGNLFRDHRARYKNDVLTITGVESIVNVSDESLDIKGNDAYSKGLLVNENEQKNVLRSLSTISARVVRVFNNGTMFIQGEKVDYRRSNAVRYLTTVQGIARPEDVSSNNEISAIKLAKAEVKLKRQFQQSALKRLRKAYKKAREEKIREARNRKKNPVTDQNK